MSMTAATAAILMTATLAGAQGNPTYLCAPEASASFNCQSGQACKAASKQGGGSERITLSGPDSDMPAIASAEFSGALTVVGGTPRVLAARHVMGHLMVYTWSPASKRLVSLSTTDLGVAEFTLLSSYVCAKQP